MFIQTEETPNPNTLKFIPGRDVFTAEYNGFPASYSKDDDLTVSPFAKKLLSTQGVTSVFYGADFITITKDQECEWYILKPHILGTIMEHFINHFPLILKEGQPQKAKEYDSLSEKIIEILDTRVRPAVAQDGGDIVFESFEDGIVYLKMKGSCAGCPSSSATLKGGIENMLKFYIPEVKEVRQSED